MATMKAAIYTGIREIEVRQVERSRPEPGQVLLDTRCTGICGSDLHSYFGTWGQSHTRAAGHETCGIVAEVGAGVTGFAVGDTVAVECFSHCGECVYCTTGQYAWPPGRLSQYPRRLRRVHRRACLGTVQAAGRHELRGWGAGRTACGVVAALAQAGAGSRDRVPAIIGGGTIGQFALAAAKAVGVRETLITVK